MSVLQMMTAKMGERDSREEIMKAFKLFDDDNTGRITLKNLKRVAKELGENLTEEELQVSKCWLQQLMMNAVLLLRWELLPMHHTTAAHPMHIGSHAPCLVHAWASPAPGLVLLSRLSG